MIPFNNTHFYNTIQNYENITIIDDNYIILDVHISCDTFYNYSFKIPINKNNYYNNHTNKNILFKKLEKDICIYVTAKIYFDLLSKNNINLLSTLNYLSSKFHIHGRTIDDILFPHLHSHNPHIHNNDRLYICSHC